MWNLWAMYFSAVVTWNYHPGNRKERAALPIIDCGKVADAMLKETVARAEYFANLEAEVERRMQLWHGSVRQ